MTQEDKEVLLKELCARLPYNVKCKVHLDTEGYCLRDEDKYCDDTLESVNCKKQTCTFNKSIGYDFGNFAIEEVKPYLRPMSSMTEDEKRHISKIMCLSTYVNGVVYDMTYPIYIPYYVMEDCLSYLRSIHVDYSGLIEKGLALEAPANMYKID